MGQAVARAPAASQVHYERRRPEETTLYLLTRTGYLIEEQGMSYLAQPESDRALTPLQAAACTYRIALGPQAWQKVLSLQTVPARRATPSSRAASTRTVSACIGSTL